MPLIRKVRYFIRLINAILKRYYLIIIFGIIFGGIATVAIVFGYSKISRISKHTDKIGLVGQYTLSNLPDEILSHLSLGLTRYNDKGEIVSGIADKWTVGDEGKRYEFFIIPEKYTWNDSKPFSITDLSFNFKDVDIEKNPQSIVFKLNDAFAPLPSILTKPIVKNGLTGLGDYRVQNYLVSGTTLKQIKLTSLKPDDNNLLYRFYPTVSDLINGFNLGEVDHIDELYSVDGIAEGRHVSIESYVDTQSFTALYFNTQLPELSDKAFRQSLAYSLQKPVDDSRSLSSYSPKSWVYNGTVKPYRYDVNRSFELTSKEDLQRSRELVISVLSQDIPLAEQIITDFKQIGIQSRYEVISFLPDNYDMVLISREMPIDPDQYSFWHSTQKGNLSKLRNPRLDKLLEDGRKTIDPVIRRNIYLDFQRYLLEDCPAVFISYPTIYKASRI